MQGHRLVVGEKPPSVIGDGPARRDQGLVTVLVLVTVFELVPVLVLETVFGVDWMAFFWPGL